MKLQQPPELQTVTQCAPNLPVLPYIAPVYPESLEAPLVPFSHYAWILKRHSWRILIFTVVAMLLTFVISKRLTPIYQAIAIVDIDRDTPSAIVGKDAARLPSDDPDEFISTQVKLIQSDAVLRPVLSKYGSLLKTVDNVRIKANEDSPIEFGQLKVSRPPNTYLVLISFRSREPQLAADVANAIANSYIETSYRLRFESAARLSKFMEEQLGELRMKMGRSGAALSEFERQLNVINPEDKINILSARLLQLNTEYASAQADRLRKEAAYTAVKSGTFDAAQVSNQSESLRFTLAELTLAQERFADARRKYGDGHPEYQKAAEQLAEIQRESEQALHSVIERVRIEYAQSVNQEQMLHNTVTDTKAEWDGLNARSRQYQALKQEADADKKLYDELISRIKEAGINSGFQSSNLRLVDPARPDRGPVFPRVRLSVALAGILSLVLAVTFAVVHDLIDTTVKDPEQVSRFLNINVIGVLPSVRGLAVIKAPASYLRNGHRPVFGNAESLNAYGEAVRTLRNTILLTAMRSNCRSLLITSALPGEGKTTTAVNLARAHAEQGKRTLIIDGDLRKAQVHLALGMDPSMGLSDILRGDTDWQSVIRSVPNYPDLSAIIAGRASKRSADIVGPFIVELLDILGNDFDLVIVDGPPMLGLAEPLQLAAGTDGVMLVAHAGETRRNAVAAALVTLRQINANVVGIVLNKVKKNMSEGYYSTYYNYNQPHYNPRPHLGQV